MPSAKVNNVLLHWARTRANIGTDTLAKSLNIKEEKLVAWEAGYALPTFKQAQKLAHITHIPFGYLFLSELPEETLPIPDLRTVRNNADIEPSIEFRDTITSVMQKLNWYSEYLNDNESDPVPFIRKFTCEDSPKDVARDIAATIGITDQLRRTAVNWEGFLEAITVQAEKSGVWIMRNSIVGNNAHRPLRVDEFRGFAIIDPFAPVIFINGKDAKAAQIFTLAHELAHLWIGESGVSNPSLSFRKEQVGNQIELFCNEVAAELLVPEEHFHEKWDSSVDISESANNIARYFRVSSVVAARRAYDLNLVDWDTYWDFFERQRELWRSRPKRTGGNPFPTYMIRNGRRFSRAVIYNAFEGKLLFRHAAALLGLKSVTTLKKIAREMNIV